ncbi:MAG: aminotransferase class III-fold pyridoxal phosphate-dependent enzyme, partial [Steroidobacteraceae bacterium]|nr:aminotransferase class III-fold pyridoxal phosphate-dependent enzyme [Steroidobacteraceae bacterium]
LDVIAAENLLARAQRIGARMLECLRELQQAHPAVVGDVRGLGAMVAMELVRGGTAAQPDRELAQALVQAASTRGLVVLSCGIHGNVIRLLPPLTISDAELDEGLALLAEALAAVVRA